jgi:hypothetical protein
MDPLLQKTRALVVLEKSGIEWRLQDSVAQKADAISKKPPEHYGCRDADSQYEVSAWRKFESS